MKARDIIEAEAKHFIKGTGSFKPVLGSCSRCNGQMELLDVPTNTWICYFCGHRERFSATRHFVPKGVTNEAEAGPRQFLKQVRQKVIPSSRDGYWIVFGAPPLNIQDKQNNEYCPWAVFTDGFEQQDGMYGLLNDIEDHFKFTPSFRRYPDHPDLVDFTDDEHETVSQAYGHYLHQIDTDLRRAKAHGIAKGVLGDRAWQLVRWNGKNGPIEAVPDNFSVIGPPGD